jgi:hypothetical protein
MKAGKVSNFINSSKLKMLLDMFESLPDEANAGEFRAYTNGISKGHQFYDFINTQLCNDLIKLTGTNMSITIAMLLKESVPWSVHTDYQKGDQNPGMAFLIPISWNGPENSFTHTVIFNEESTESFESFQKTAEKKVLNATHLRDNLCGHISTEKLEYISLLEAYQWNPGDLIFWDRKLLHCSDNFLKQNITQKTAIVIFTENL